MSCKPATGGQPCRELEVELVLGPGALGAWAERGDGEMTRLLGPWRRGAGDLVAWWKRQRAADAALHRRRTRNWRCEASLSPYVLGESLIGIPSALIIVDWDAVQP
jgi:hypothetical protein